MSGEWIEVDTAKGTHVRVLQAGARLERPSERDERPDVVLVHGAGGIEGVYDDFVERLAQSYRVHVPEMPGYGESTGEELLEDMLDFTLHGWDVVDALGIDRPHLVGHSMGGMIAAEMACIEPARPASLSLLAPAGVWIDEHPIADIFATLPHDLPALLFHDPAAGAAALTGGVDFSDMDALVAFFITNAKRLGTAGKILFPIPNRRLSKRVYRLTAPTLLVWGESDRLIPPVYASRWQELIPHADLVTIGAAGHMLPMEQPDDAASALEKHLGSIS